jgi:hypothetical protein
MQEMSNACRNFGGETCWETDLEHRQENGRIYLDGTYADKF